MKKINKNTKVILIAILIFIGITLYGIYFYHSNIYEEFEESEATKELIPYEEDKQNTNTSGEDKTSNMVNEGDNAEDEIIIVHITGAVRNWGIIELPVNSRIADAIEKAGGLTEEADISNINLAYILEDGMKINIPSIYDVIQSETKEESEENYISKENGENIISSRGNNSSVNNSRGKNSKTEENIVNINTATQTELETLPGIGTSTALKIINYRNENGRFETIDDIKNVSGIGDIKFNNIKDLICI